MVCHLVQLPHPLKPHMDARESLIVYLRRSCGSFWQVSLVAPPKDDSVSKEEDGETKPAPDEASSLSDIERKEAEAKKKEWERMRGMVEKKTYIGLVSLPSLSARSCPAEQPRSRRSRCLSSIRFVASQGRSTPTCTG